MKQNIYQQRSSEERMINTIRSVREAFLEWVTAKLDFEG